MENIDFLILIISFVIGIQVLQEISSFILVKKTELMQEEKSFEGLVLVKKKSDKKYSLKECSKPIKY